MSDIPPPEKLFSSSHIVAQMLIGGRWEETDDGAMVRLEADFQVGAEKKTAFFVTTTKQSLEFSLGNEDWLKHEMKKVAVKQHINMQ